jgi:hypothetical protein
VKSLFLRGALVLNLGLLSQRQSSIQFCLRKIRLMNERDDEVDADRLLLGTRLATQEKKDIVAFMRQF